jgi:hypothetical protein
LHENIEQVARASDSSADFDGELRVRKKSRRTQKECGAGKVAGNSMRLDAAQSAGRRECALHFLVALKLRAKAGERYFAVIARSQRF